MSAPANCGTSWRRTTELVPVGLEHLQTDLDRDLAELMRDAL